MRGKLGVRQLFLLYQGITPADAGKTGFTEVTGDDAKDHPRGCGENHNCDISAFRRIGSPPRMRGKHHVNAPPSSDNRITPADAGKTVPAMQGISLI